MDTDAAHERSLHSFVIRIWLEETAEDTGRTLWRGHITHIPGDERAYLKNLEEILPFIRRYANVIS